MVQSRRKTREPKEENVTLGPAVRDGEHVFGVAHVFASFNDTFIVRFHLSISLCVSVLDAIDIFRSTLTDLFFCLAACH